MTGKGCPQALPLSLAMALALFAGNAEAASTADARKGRVLITVLHDASGQTDGARYYAGRFMFRQGK